MNNNYKYDIINLDNSFYAYLINEKIRNIGTYSEKYKVTITGSSILFLNGTKYLVRNLFTSLFLVIICISIFMAWMFNSFRMVVVSLIPNLIPLLKRLTFKMMSFGPKTILNKLSFHNYN